MLSARLKPGETLGDRVMKVDHAGEHGAVCMYRAQILGARLRAPAMVEELEHFLGHELGHRARFAAELDRRGRRRCRSYLLCGLGGWLLGLATGIAGAGAIAATTIAIERIVLAHMREQLRVLSASDAAAATVLRAIIVEEQEHHDVSASRLPGRSLWQAIIDPIVSGSTEAVIWMGMRL